MSKKGWEHPKKLKKLEKFKSGLPILCKRHGEHTRWRMHSDNNVQCLQCASHYQRERKKKNPFKTLWRDAKSHAKKNGHSFEITPEYIKQIYEMQMNRCNLSGIEFNEKNLPSLDRINSSVGYIKNNLQLLTIKINRMKSNLDEKEFIDICKKIAFHKETHMEKVFTQE
jgi:hypothetical protein